MRDKLKDENYFNRLIEEKESRIIRAENLQKQLITERGESDRGTRAGYTDLVIKYLDIINLLYSGGSDLEIIEGYYKKLLPYYGKMWDRNYGYIDLIKVLSLGVLFGIDKKEIAVLEEKLKAENFDDYLVNVLIKSVDPGWMNSGTEFEFPRLYDYLKTVLESDASQTCDMLKEYLEKKWYKIHRQCAWYNSHKKDRDLYYGYWSFDAGAIAKILKLDDLTLKDVSYYPYDLVHYK